MTNIIKIKGDDLDNNLNFTLNNFNDAIMAGGGGADVFNFYYQLAVSNGSAAGLSMTPNADVTIVDFNVGVDQLSFQTAAYGPSGGITLKAEDSYENASGDLVLVTPQGSTITLIGLTSADLPNLVFANGSLDFAVTPINPLAVTLGDDDNFYFGTNKDDIIYGEEGNDTINGLNGDDEIYGGQGNDKLIGGNGDDYLDGGVMNDLLSGGQGDDILIGGQGDDKLRAGNGDDELNGGRGDDILFGNSGNDVISDGEGNDIIFGGSGDDTINIGLGNDKILAGNGDDTIHVSSGNDSIKAGNGDDIIIFDSIASFANAGTNKVAGGAGSDTYVDNNQFVSHTTYITDFEIGVDKLDLNIEFASANIQDTAQGVIVEDFILMGVTSDEISAGDFI